MSIQEESKDGYIFPIPNNELKCDKLVGGVVEQQPEIHGILGGGFKHIFIFTPAWGKMIEFDYSYIFQMG